MPATAVELRNIPAKTRDDAKASDFAGKNRSFPILKPADVSAAAKAIGRAGADNYSSDQLKANIIRIAKRKGASFVAQLPKAWTDTKTSASIQLPGQAIVLATDDAGEGPATTWIQVLRTGKFWSARYKDFAVTKATLRKMLENFTSLTPKAPTELPLDYNHGTNRPDTIEQGKAAGWIKSLELREADTELWAQVALTEEAADLVRNQEYRYVSATFEFDHVHTDGEQRQKHIGATLLAAALTNTPFVEGMQPVTLGKQAAIALADDEAAEADFTFDETRRRIQAALTEAYGSPNSGGCCAPCYGVYIVDTYDDYVIYCESDGSKYRVDYALGADGAITFTSDPIEVRVAYEPLSSAAEAEPVGATDMATIKVKDAKGNEIELTDEVVKALAKEHAPKPAAPAAVDDAALDEIRTTLTKAEGENQQLSARIATLEQEKKETAAKGLVDALVRAGKVPLKKRDQYVTLAINDRKTFMELTSDLPVIYQFGKESGSGEDGGDISATQEVLALAREEMKADSKLTNEQAISRVLGKNRPLYERYKQEAAVRV